MTDLTSADNWNSIADRYAQWTVGHLQPYSAQVVERAELAADHRVLDVACGPGTLTTLVADLVEHVDAVDFAPRMVELCAARTPANVKAQVADGHHLPFDDAVFDVAFSMFGLAFFADRPAALRELHRVLKPGGAVWIGTWVPFAESPAMLRMGPVMKTLDPDMTPPEGIAMNNETIICDELTDAGFREIEVHNVPGFLHIDDVDAMWDRFIHGNLFLRHIRHKIGEDRFAERAPAAKAAFAHDLEPGMRISQPALAGFGRK